MPIPPKCLLFLYTVDTPRVLTHVDETTLLDVSCKYEELQLEPMLYALRPHRPHYMWLSPPMALAASNTVRQYMHRVVSSNGISYPLASRINEHPHRGAVWYLQAESRRSYSANSTSRSLRNELTRVDHAWHEPLVTSYVLLDGTRYIVVDNRDSTSAIVEVVVYTVPTGELCHPGNANPDVTDRNRSGFRVQLRRLNDALWNHSSYSARGDSRSRVYDEMHVLYDTPDDNRHVVVQTMLDPTDDLHEKHLRAMAHTYRFDEGNNIIVAVMPRRRVIVCERHTDGYGDIVERSRAAVNVPYDPTGKRDDNDGSAVIRAEDFAHFAWLSSDSSLDARSLRTPPYTAHANGENVGCGRTPALYHGSVVVDANATLHIRDYSDCLANMKSETTAAAAVNPETNK